MQQGTLNNQKDSQNRKKGGFVLFNTKCNRVIAEIVKNNK